MKHVRSIRLTGALFGVACALVASTTLAADYPGGDYEIYFSPRGGCMAKIVQQINSAQRTIHMQSYSFTSLKIEAALEAAKARGVQVQVILDKSWSVSSPRVKPLLVSAGIETLIDSKHAIAHNKVIIVDNERVLTGSFNYTAQAELYNAENLLLIRNRTIAAEYEANFQAHKDHSVAQ